MNVAQMYYRKHSNNFAEGLRFYKFPDPGYHVNWECHGLLRLTGGSSPSFEGIPFKRNDSSASKCVAHAQCINLPFCLPDQQSLKTLSQRINNTAPYSNDNSSIMEEKNQKGPQRKATMIYSVRLI